MKTNLINVVDDAHTYELQNHESESTQTVHFIKKESDPTTETGMKTVQEGTTNEAVLQMLISRTQSLNEKFPSEFNEDAIKHMELALSALYARTADREKRGVEGTHQA